MGQNLAFPRIFQCYRVTHLAREYITKSACPEFFIYFQSDVQITTTRSKTVGESQLLATSRKPNHSRMSIVNVLFFKSENMSQCFGETAKKAVDLYDLIWLRNIHRVWEGGLEGGGSEGNNLVIACSGGSEAFIEASKTDPYTPSTYWERRCEKKRCHPIPPLQPTAAHTRAHEQLLDCFMLTPSSTGNCPKIRPETENK